jgi:hypothetical protein
MILAVTDEPEFNDQESEDEHQLQILMDQDQLAGVWANFARVSHSEHEFTLDFVRLDYSQGSPPRHGLVVARVSVSPLFVTQLIDALTDNWEKYARKALPREVHGDDQSSN